MFGIIIIMTFACMFRIISRAAPLRIASVACNPLFTRMRKTRLPLANSIFGPRAEHPADLRTFRGWILREGRWESGQMAGAGNPAVRIGRGKHFPPLNWPRRGNRRMVRIIDSLLNNLPSKEERQLASKIGRGLHHVSHKNYRYLIGK